MEEHIALEKQSQKKFKKTVGKTKKVKVLDNANGKKGKKNNRYQRGIVYLGHIPHGFYEPQIYAYFQQFGKIERVRLCRSRKTGESKGYAFVEFFNSKVAKIAAESMNNYLMFNRRIVAQFISSNAVRDRKFHAEPEWSKQNYPAKQSRLKAVRIRNNNISESKHKITAEKLLVRLNNNLQKLREMGIDYKFKPTDVPEGIDKVDVQERDEEDSKHSGDIKLIKKASLDKVKKIKNKSSTVIKSEKL